MNPWQHVASQFTQRSRTAAVRGALTVTAPVWNECYFMSHDGLRLHYRDYSTGNDGRTAAKLPVLCLPGLTRNCRDFEVLSVHLQRDRRVLSADLRGRGGSARDPNWRNYAPAIYLRDIEALLVHAGAERVVIVGTSLGGILAMLIGALRAPAVAGIVLNDIGPEIDPAGRERIATYVGRNPPVRNWADAIAQAKATYGAALPDLDDAQWLAMTKRGYVEVDGVPQLEMDPMIGEALRNAPPGALPDLWPVFTALRAIPMLAFRGVLSDVLSADTFARMQREKPDLVAIDVPNRGHPALLDEPECVSAIDAFLSRLP